MDFAAGGRGPIPSQGTKIPHAVWPKKKKKKKKCINKKWHLLHKAVGKVK